MKGNQLSFGTDPEFCIVDREGQYRSAIPIINHTKEKKLDLGNGNRLFYDNVLAEMNVRTSYSERELIENLSDCLRRAAKAIHPYYLRAQASHMYPLAECQHKDAQVFGCEPEYCAYDMAQLNPPTCEAGNSFRSAGGHIHLGYTEEQYPLKAPVKNEDRTDRDWGRVWVVRMMDLFVGIPALFVDHDSTSVARRKLYGGAGTHRPKEEYGVEYRATSNFWLQSPKLASLVYRLSDFAVKFVAKKKHLELWKNESECTAYNVDDLRKIINDSDTKSARKLMETIIKKHMPTELYSQIFALSDPVQYNFYKEWNLPV